MEKLYEAAGVVNTDSSLTEVDRGSVMRIRLRVDVTLPLYRGRIFSLDNGSKGWVSFKYEQLPNVCYWCGRLNHFDKDCDHWIQSSGTLKQKDQDYGPWLWAFPLPMHNNAVIVVPRYYETKKKELDTGNRQGKKTTSKPREARGNADTAEQGGTHGGGPMDCQFQKFNTPIIEEDIMEVTKLSVVMGGNAESIQQRGGAVNRGDYFNDKLNEID